MFGADAMRDISDDYILRVAILGQQRVDTLLQVPERMAYMFTEPNWNSRTCRDFRATVPTVSFQHVVMAAQALFQQTRDIHADWPAWMATQASQVAGGKAAVQKSLRIALSGERAGPPVAEIAEVLGLHRAAERLAVALAWDEGAVNREQPH